MSKLNIKSLWIQQTKDNENTLEPTEIKVTDTEVELNEEETRICEGIIHKIRKSSEEARKINNKSTEKVLENPIKEIFSRIYEEMVTYSKRNLENNQEEINNENNNKTPENTNNQMEEGLNEENENENNGEIQESNNENDQMEENDEGNSSDELSELEDEPPKVSRKRKRGNELQDTRKKRRTEKVEELIQELETPIFEEEINEEMEDENEERNEIGELVKMFYEIEKINRKQVWKCYNYGRKFEQKVEEIKNQNKKKITSQTARGRLYEEMKKQMTGNITKEAIRKRTQRAIKVYELFTEIGRERINNIKDWSVKMIIELTTEEIKQVKNYFRREE